MHEAAEKGSLHPNPLKPNCAVHTAYPFIHSSFLSQISAVHLPGLQSLLHIWENSRVQF